MVDPGARPNSLTVPTQIPVAFALLFQLKLALPLQLFREPSLLLLARIVASTRLWRTFPVESGLVPGRRVGRSRNIGLAERLPGKVAHQRTRKRAA